MGSENLSSISSFPYLIGTRCINAIYNTYAGYTDNYYIDDEGTLVSEGTFMVSGNVPVSEGDIATIPVHASDSTFSHGAIYNSSGAWIAKLNLQTIIPSGASYVRFNAKKATGLSTVILFLEKIDYARNGASVVVCDGDSITASFAPYKPYPTFLGESLGMSVVNLGISSEKISDLLSRIGNVPLNATQSIINIGFNDFDKATTLGTISDTTNATFYGCMNLIIDWYRKNRPFCELYFCNLLRSPNTASVGGGSTLKQFSDAVTLACGNKGIQTIDLWNCGLDFLDTNNHMLFCCGDHLHPNSHGNMIISRVVYRAIL